MACGGFTCSKNALIGLNIMYILFCASLVPILILLQLVAFILIAVAAYGRTSNIVTSVSLVGGIIACGVFLLLISILGVIGAAKHHQVVLFFYMAILFVLFLIQFSVACACLAVNEDQQHSLTKTGWEMAPPELKKQVQTYFKCCSYDASSINITNSSIPMSHPSCVEVVGCCNTPTGPEGCCIGGNSTCGCQVCSAPLFEAVHDGLKGSGGIGLFFSFTEIVGIAITFRYRRMPHESIA